MEEQKSNLRKLYREREKAKGENRMKIGDNTTPVRTWRSTYD